MIGIIKIHLFNSPLIEYLEYYSVQAGIKIR